MDEESGPPRGSDEPGRTPAEPGSGGGGPPTEILDRDSVTTKTQALPAGFSAGSTPPPAPRPTARSEPRAFADGTVVAGRYRIVRYIAKGGMGEVYEAEDGELREHVALKTLLAGADATGQQLGRFKREIQLARKISHPNVCRIFDIGHHPLAAGGEVSFLTMEMLAGETLADTIARRGRFGEREALPIVRQMAGALAAAHKVGIIHRDFKSANVILVPDRDEESGFRVVVTDFGLARGREELDRFAASVSRTDAVVGTPAYMAPEQLEGRELGPEADIHALGVVLYEMLTGQLPFTGATTISIAVKRLREDPPAPRTHVPGIDGLWESVILRAMAREPGDRFRNALDLVRALEPPVSSDPIRASLLSGSGSRSVEELTTALDARAVSRASAERAKLDGAAAVPLAPSASPEPSKRSRVSLLAAAIGGTALLGLGTFLVPKLLAKKTTALVAAPTSAAPAPAKARKAIAVLLPRNLGGSSEADWIGTAIGELLSSELSAGGDLRLIPGEAVSAAAEEGLVPKSDAFTGDTLARLGARLGADVVVSGAFLVSDAKKLHLTLRAQEVRSGETVAPVTVDGESGDLATIAAKAGGTLRSALGTAPLAEAQHAAVAATLPADPEASRLYSESLALLRKFDAKGAEALLARAVAIAPEHPLVHAELAEAYAHLGEEKKAADEAAAAFARAEKLPRTERLVVEARLREATGDYAKAVELWRSLYTFAPDDVDVGLRLGDTLVAAGRGKDALALAAELRKIGLAAAADPRVDLLEGSAAESVGNVPLAQEAVASSIRRAEASGAKLVGAAAQVVSAELSRRTGSFDRAEASAAAARAVFEAAGEPAGLSRAVNTLANIRFSRGDLDGARKLHEESLAISRKVGRRNGIADALSNLGGILFQQRDAKGATARYSEAIAVRRETGDRDGLADSLTGLGNVRLESGDLPGAKSAYEEAATLRRELGDESGLAGCQNNLALVAERQGDADGAARLYAEAVAIRKKLGELGGVADIQGNLGLSALAAGDLAKARTLQQEALDLRKKLGDEAGTAICLVNLGEVTVDAGDFAAAEPLLAEAERLGRKLPLPAATGWALHLRSLVAAEKNDAAAKKFEEDALAVRTAAGDGEGVLESRLSIARLGDASVDAELGKIAATAKSYALGDLAVRATLARVEKKLAAGKPDEAEKLLVGAELGLEKSAPAAVRHLLALRRLEVDFARLKPGTPIPAPLRAKGEALAKGAGDGGFVPVALEARLLLALGDVRAGDAAAAARRDGIVDEAKSRGLLRIAARK